jgi:hypothetical protein
MELAEEFLMIFSVGVVSVSSSWFTFQGGMVRVVEWVTCNSVVGCLLCCV